MKATHTLLGAALLACSTICWSFPLAAVQSQSTTALDITPAQTPFILVELSDTLNAKKLKPGDRVKAQVAQDVVARGRVVIPVDSKLMGHVTEAKPLQTNENTESRLAIVFDKVVLKHHEEVNFHGVVHAVAPPVKRVSLVDMPDPMLPQIVTRQSSPIQPLGKNTNRQPSAPTPPGRGGNIPGQAISPAEAVLSPQNYQTERGPSSTSGSVLSVGTRQGVFGLKGLSLIPDTGEDASGPVIVSTAGNVKLEYGTQVLLRITDVSPRH